MVSFRANLAGGCCRTYRRQLTALILGVLLACGGAAPAEGAEPAGMERWLAHQADIQTWSADVVQTRSLKSLSQPLVTKGRVWFQAPNLFRWELGDPARTIAIREPERLVLLYPQLRRAEVYSLAEDAAGPWRSSLTLLEAGFPRQEQDLTRQFNVLAVEPQGENSVVKLEPKSAEARRWVTSIEVTLRTNDLNLVSTQLTFADGSQLRNEFTNATANPKISADLLQAAIPEDYQVSTPAQ